MFSHNIFIRFDLVVNNDHHITVQSSVTAPPPSLQHVDVAALLIKYNSPVNATDRWGFTPLHEAAQKGRTQLCSLLVWDMVSLTLLPTNDAQMCRGLSRSQ